jgi:hypothetical protein
MKVAKYQLFPPDEEEHAHPIKRPPNTSTATVAIQAHNQRKKAKKHGRQKIRELIRRSRQSPRLESMDAKTAS